MKNLSLLFVAFLFLHLTTFAQDFWEPTDGPYGALILSISMNSSGDLFAGSRNHGIFRSTDNGDNWTPANSGLISIGIYSLAINSNGHLFAGTRDGEGMFRSTDNGENWFAINNGLTNNEINCCAINSQDHIFAGSAEGNGGLFRSTDNGNNWIQKGFENKDVYRIAFDENSIVFVTTLGDGIFRSTDNGDNWTPINNGLTNLVVGGIGFNSAGYIFIGTFDGIFRSTDSGSNWALVDSSYLPLIFDMNSSGDFFSISYMNPGNGMIRSTDDGETWTEVNYSTMDSDPVFVYIAENDDMFIGSWSGIYYTHDNAQTFIKKNKGMLCGVLSFCSNSSNHIFAGSDGIGVFRSEDDGLNWTYINNGLAPTSENKRIDALCSNSDDYIFAARGGVYRSQDNGDSWISCNINKSVEALCINSNDFIFAGTDEGVFRSDNNGDSWTEINNGLTYDSPVNCLVVNSNGDIFASTYGRVYRSTDNGNSWIEIRPLPFDCMAINSSNHIYGGTDFDDIHLSTDNGDSWTDASDIPATSLAINSLDHIFAGNESTGVFRSTDNGGTWIQINSGLTNTQVLSLTLNSNEYIFAGTLNGGVFRSRESTITSVHRIDDAIPVSFELKQNYPNPFNPVTTIKYDIKERSFVELKIYDVLGREVNVLVNEEQVAGNYKAEFDASGLTSGVYFYQLRTGSFVETKKMVLLR